jgi:hypothetical protein
VKKISLNPGKQRVGQRGAKPMDKGSVRDTRDEGMGKEIVDHKDQETNHSRTVSSATQLLNNNVVGTMCVGE